MCRKCKGWKKSGKYLKKCRVQRDEMNKLLNEKGKITEAEFMQKLSDERDVYQAMFGEIW